MNTALDSSTNASRMRAPRIERHGEVVYFIDADARRWRVYDTSSDAPDALSKRVTIHRAGSALATTRLFVPSDPDALRYSHSFRPHTPRDLTVELLYRQLLSAVAFRRQEEGRRATRQRIGFRRIAMFRLSRHQENE